MPSARQLAASRQNGARSKGPVTQEGRDVSRRNALKHGLAAEVLLTPEEADAVALRTSEWRPWYDLAGPGPDWKVDRWYFVDAPR